MMRYYRNSKYNYSCRYCRRGVDYFSNRCGSCGKSLGWGGTPPGDNILAVKIILAVILAAFIWFEVIEPVLAYILSGLIALVQHV